MRNIKTKIKLSILILFTIFVIQACDQNVGERQIIIKNKSK